MRSGDLVIGKPCDGSQDEIARIARIAKDRRN